MKLSESKPTPQLIKMMLMGISGTGKTSAIIPLAIPEIIPGWPGLELRVADFDGKFAEVATLQLKARLDKAKARRADLTPITQEQFDAALSNIDVVVCRESTSVIDQGRNKAFGVRSADAWQTALKQFKLWLPTMSSSNVLVVDSLTHMCAGIAGYTQELGGKLNMKMTWRDFLPAQQEVAAAMTFFADAPSNVIICAHQAPLDVSKKTGEFRELPNGTKEEVEEVVDSHMMPITIGTAGRISIPSQLNHLLVMDDNEKGQRQLFIRPKVGVVTKTPFFALAEPSYGIDRGLVEYWRLGQ